MTSHTNSLTQHRCSYFESHLRSRPCLGIVLTSCSMMGCGFVLVSRFWIWFIINRLFARSGVCLFIRGTTRLTGRTARVRLDASDATNYAISVPILACPNPIGFSESAARSEKAHRTRQPDANIGPSLCYPVIDSDPNDSRHKKIVFRTILNGEARRLHQSLWCAFKAVPITDISNVASGIDFTRL